MSDVIKNYKALKSNMTCRDFQYEENHDYETETVRACKEGFHACEYPLNVFSYYPLGNSVYHEIERSGKFDRDSDD